MPVTFTVEAGTMTVQNNNQMLVLDDGRKIQADALQNGDVFTANGSPVTVTSVPVVS